MISRNNGEKFRLLYQPLKTVLSSDASLLAICPAANIKPADDPTTPEKGGLIVYWWTGSEWNKRTKRGSGSLNVLIAHPAGKDKALKMAEYFRANATARALSSVQFTDQEETINLNVALFKEVAVASDANQTQNGAWQVSTQFKVLLA